MMEYLLLIGLGLVCMAFGYWVGGEDNVSSLSPSKKFLDDCVEESTRYLTDRELTERALEFIEVVLLPELSEHPCNDPVACAYVRRIRNECDGLVEYLHNKGDQISSDKADRVAARIYKPLRQVDGIVNGFSNE
jgi:hypothetical protein